MSPEYALDGFFSIKSDVFSFGVIMLEIISGKRTAGFYHPEGQQNLVSHVSDLYLQKFCFHHTLVSLTRRANNNQID